jgi:hypothetical protein
MPFPYGTSRGTSFERFRVYLRTTDRDREGQNGAQDFFVYLLFLLSYPQEYLALVLLIANISPECFYNPFLYLAHD